VRRRLRDPDGAAAFVARHAIDATPATAPATAWRCGSLARDLASNGRLVAET